MFSVNEYWSFQVHGHGGHSGGIVEGMNNFLAFLDSLSGHSSSEVFAMVFPGIAALMNFHPLVVHYPIALLTSFFVVELAAVILKKEPLSTLASGLLYLGTFFAAITVYFGFQAAETVAHDEVVHIIMERHEGYGVTVLCLALLLSVWRGLTVKYPHLEMKKLFVSLAGILTILLTLGADLGGAMVYGHAVGVNLPATQSADPNALPTLQDYQQQMHDHGSGHEHSHSHDHGDDQHEH